MPTPQSIIDVALAEVGYYAPADPEPGSKYGRWMADLTGESWLAGPSESVWWCCMFVSWVLAQAGQECRGFPSYNTDATLAQRPPCIDSGDAQPGDIVIFDWDGNRATDHIGIVYKRDGGALKCIEGNYGNSVAVVDRSASWGYVSAVIRPPYCTPALPENFDLDTVARQVINGDWGNGDERRARLEAAGYSYKSVQDMVNAILAPASVAATNVEVLALQVINGDWGNGSERVERLTAAGYDAGEVQRRVNQILL